MNYNSLLIILLIFLLGCDQNNLNKNIVDQEVMTKYKNSGFALVYDTSAITVFWLTGFVILTKEFFLRLL